MTFELGHISVAAGDLADIINEARRIMENAENHAAHPPFQEWQDAITRLEGFRAEVAVLLGVSSMNNDTHLLDALRKLTSGKREWQCPVCQEWVLGAHLMCPTCTGDQAPTVTPQDTNGATDGERTGRFHPVPQPLTWDPPATTEPEPVTPEPAHALIEPPTPAQVVSDLLALVGYTVTADHIRDRWTPEQLEQAADWAGSVHLNASDNVDVVVPERPAFLDDAAAQAPWCVAHRHPACRLCSLNPAECASQADGGCSTYRDTGMHWDTCPNSVYKIDDDGVWHTRDGRLIDPALGDGVATSG